VSECRSSALDSRKLEFGDNRAIAGSGSDEARRLTDHRR
jgi:hypothetical protein